MTMEARAHHHGEAGEQYGRAPSHPVLASVTGVSVRTAARMRAERARGLAAISAAPGRTTRRPSRRNRAERTAVWASGAWREGLGRAAERSTRKRLTVRSSREWNVTTARAGRRDAAGSRPRSARARAPRARRSRRCEAPERCGSRDRCRRARRRRSGRPRDARRRRARRSGRSALPGALRRWPGRSAGRGAPRHSPG